MLQFKAEKQGLWNSWQPFSRLYAGHMHVPFWLSSQAHRNRISFRKSGNLEWSAESFTNVSFMSSALSQEFSFFWYVSDGKLRLDLVVAAFTEIMFLSFLLWGLIGSGGKFRRALFRYTSLEVIAASFVTQVCQEDCPHPLWRMLNFSIFSFCVSQGLFVLVIHFFLTLLLRNEGVTRVTWHHNQMWRKKKPLLYRGILKLVVKEIPWR